ncbi:MAG TPA: hypothetical protein VF824_01220 [Thermoanaerobaculia bacterium]|jgi:hypothetical protein
MGQGQVVITITADPSGKVTVNPPVATANRNNQQLVWNINNASGGRIVFLDPPITFPTTAKPHVPPYKPWPGSRVTAGPGANQYQANINHQVQIDGEIDYYYYDVVWKGGSLDPDIANQGFPPPTDDDEHGGGHGGHGKPPRHEK